MKFPKEQYSKSAGMNSETPLLVLKRSTLKITLRLLLCSFAMIGLFFIGSHAKGGAVYLVFICFLIAVLGVAEALFVKGFKLYSDRVEKCYWFYKKTVYLESSDINITNRCYWWAGVGMLLVRAREIIIEVEPVGSYFYRLLMGVRYDLSLGYDNVADLDSFIGCCESIGIKFLKGHHHYCLTKITCEDVEVSRKWQDLMPVEMNNKVPLLTLRYAPAKIIFKWFVPYLVLVFIVSCYFLPFMFRLYSGEPVGKTKTMCGIIIVSCFLLFILGVVGIIKALFTEVFEVYSDRIDKRYGFCGKKIRKSSMQFKDAYIFIYPDNLSVIRKDDYIDGSSKKIIYHFHLGHDESLDSDVFVGCFQSIGIEFLKSDDRLVDKRYYEGNNRV